MFEIERIEAELERVVAALDPACLEGRDAARLTETAARIERFGGIGQDAPGQARRGHQRVARPIPRRIAGAVARRSHRIVRGRGPRDVRHRDPTDRPPGDRRAAPVWRALAPAGRARHRRRRGRPVRRATAARHRAVVRACASCSAENERRDRRGMRRGRSPPQGASATVTCAPGPTGSPPEGSSPARPRTSPSSSHALEPLEQALRGRPPLRRARAARGLPLRRHDRPRRLGYRPHQDATRTGTVLVGLPVPPRRPLRPGRDLRDPRSRTRPRRPRRESSPTGCSSW